MAWKIEKQKFLTTRQVQNLFSSLNDAKDLALQRNKNYSHIRDFFIIVLLLETGLRVSELANIKISNWRSKRLFVENGKGGKSRDILLAAKTQRSIKKFIKIKAQVLNEPTDPESFLFLSERGAPYSSRGIRKRVKFWFQQCGLPPGLSCHSCRHTYISHMIRSGVELSLVRDNAGHSNLATTSIYTHSLTEDLGELDLYSSAFVRSRNKKGRK